MKIAIIGGGITGLTTGLALHKLGVESAVYEQTPSLSEIGAGVWLQPNAMKVYDWLGLKDKITEEGAELTKVEVTYPDLRPIKMMKKGVVADEHGNQTVAVHRGRLQAILYQRFSEVGEVALGKKYQGHTNTGDTICVSLGSKSVDVDILLGADGIHSKVRDQLVPEAVLRDAGQICWRGTTHFKLPDTLKNTGKEMWGKGIRFGFSSIGENQVYWFAVANSDAYSTQLDKDALATVFKDFNPLVATLITNTEYMHTAIIKDLKRLPTWHAERACLLGDAAHATTPNMGQGACQGIEDAYYISNLLQRSASAKEVFQAFESARRKKVDYVVNNSWTFGKMAHNRLGQALLRTIMKITPENVLDKQMDKLYQISAF